jgi:hypothetical protein
LLATQFRDLKSIFLGYATIETALFGAPAFVAQRIEHLTTDQKVGGSSPSKRTNVKIHLVLLVTETRFYAAKLLIQSFGCLIGIRRGARG